MGICNAKKQERSEKSISQKQLQDEFEEQNNSKIGNEPPIIKIKSSSYKQVEEEKIQQSIQNETLKKQGFENLQDFDSIYQYLTNENFIDSLIKGSKVKELCENPHYKNGSQMLILALKISNNLGKDKHYNLRSKIPKNIVCNFNKKARPAISELSQEINVNQQLALECLTITVQTYHTFYWYFQYYDKEKWFEDQYIYEELDNKYKNLVNQIYNLLNKPAKMIDTKVNQTSVKNKKFVVLQTTKDEKTSTVCELTKQFLDTLYTQTLREIQYLDVNQEIIEFDDEKNNYVNVQDSDIKKQALKIYRPGNLNLQYF